ncbi:MAG: hypothetical protein J6J31_08820 [Thermoguttaceae bacterium]|nr:hypothetical protein [Thermoguttaceae bacterium]
MYTDLKNHEDSKDHPDAVTEEKTGVSMQADPQKYGGPVQCHTQGEQPHGLSEIQYESGNGEDQ